MAGANTWLHGGKLPPEAEDGFLTALDVSALDLLVTELTVLAACHTTIGKVYIGEGVFNMLAPQRRVLDSLGRMQAWLKLTIPLRAIVACNELEKALRLI